MQALRLRGHYQNGYVTHDLDRGLEIFADRLIPLGIPIIYGLALGHGKYKATLPVGVQVTLDGNKGQLIINEAGVK